MTVLYGCNGGSNLDDIDIKLVRPSSDTATNGILPIQVAVTGGEADRVEVLIDGDWFPICADHHTANDHGAEAACKMLGYAGGKVVKTGEAVLKSMVTESARAHSYYSS